MPLPGKESYRSNFMLPATIRDNAPYTIEAWILNPEIAENECVADFTSSRRTGETDAGKRHRTTLWCDESLWMVRMEDAGYKG